MIYFDNAATTLKKPETVVRAVMEAMGSMGNSGRGGHDAALEASRLIFDTRKKVAEFFHVENPKQIAFTMNATESLNMAIKGILRPGDRVVTTALEHNSVLRPLYEMEDQGVQVIILPGDSQGRISYEEMEQAIRGNTRMIICTHASNVTGNLLDLERIGAMAEAHGVLFAADVSQTAGIFPIDVQKMKIDVLCFTGHKGMLGPQGTGGIYVREGIPIRPLLSGGTGIRSFDRKHPEQMPTVLEAGTLNGHGLAGLRAAVCYLQEQGIDAIREKEQKLMWNFYEEVQEIPGVTVYGDFGTKERCAVVALNVWSYDSSEVSDALFRTYGISTRSGAHCAPLMHRALGTERQGAVRFSFSQDNTEEEVAKAVTALRELADETEESD